MPERDNTSPQDDPSTRLGDLFENLPAPTTQIPTVDNTPPAPGSRRAAREAAANASSSPAAPIPDAAPAAAPDAAPLPTAPNAAGAPDSTAASEVPQAEPTAPPAEPQPTSAAEPAPGAGTGTDVSEPLVGGGLDDLFQRDPDHDGPHTPKKRKRRTGCLVALIIVLALIGGAVFGGFWVMNTYGDKISDALGWGEPADWEPGLATGETTVAIHEGDNGAAVSAALFDAGVTRTEDVFYDYLVDENVAFTFYPGVYTMQTKMTAAAALDALNNPENKMENTVSVSEGATIATILPGISETMGFPIEDLQAAVADPSAYGVDAQSLEGWLFPAVYTFDPGVTAEQVIQRLVDRTRQSLTEAGVPDADAQRVLTIASIIQREGRTDDFAKVSRVIQNRLDIDMKLQMDSTAQYGYGSLHEGVVSSSAEALEDPNEWNTYVHEGLPATPIASPSDAAILAAMQPADGPWLYFVTVNLATGETVFSTTYEQHQEAIKQWDAWCRANPDGGCS